MHQYSINSLERQHIPFYLAAISMLLVYLLKGIFRLPEWVPVPSAFAIYAALYKLFDQFIWKLKFLHNIGLIHTPNLNGQWTMETSSSLTEYKVIYKGGCELNKLGQVLV